MVIGGDSEWVGFFSGGFHISSYLILKPLAD